MFAVEVLVPIAVCVILPVLIVAIVGRVRQNETNRRAEIMLKAIENGQTVDPELFKAPEKQRKTVKMELLDKLTGACITTLMGIAFLCVGLLYICNPVWRAFINPSLLLIAGGVLLAVGIGNFSAYFVGKKTLAAEIEAEEKALLNK